MATTYVKFGLIDFLGLCKLEKGWYEADPDTLLAKTDEMVFDFWPKTFKSANRRIVIRVYSSIDPATKMVRSCGADAIRVCAVDLDNSKGYIKARRVHRVEGWRDNLKSRVMATIQAALDRFAREGAAKTTAPAPADVKLAPTHPVVPADLKTKKARLAWLRDQCNINDAVALAVALTIFEYQTCEEQDAQATIVHNGVGFSGNDAEILTSFINQFNAKGWLSPKQRAILRAKSAKYAKQYLTVSGKFDAASKSGRQAA